MKVVAYYRVSTAKQGASGLGIEAQREAIRKFLGDDYPPIREFTETESGKRTDRPELQKALAFAKQRKVSLAVAKVDRLARNVAFLELILGSGVEVVFCDLPQVKGAMGRFIIQQMASVAQLEAGLVSERTKSALAAAKARGRVLGGFRGVKVNPALGTAALRAQARENAKTVGPVIAEIEAAGASSLRAVASGLNERGLTTPRGKEWTAMAVRNAKLQLARAA
jgi:DNA invertase Pin-like site-specific DNA recombinase